MTVLEYDRVWVEEPNLLIPRKKPIRQMRVDTTHALGKTCKGFFMPQSVVSPCDVVSRRALTHTGASFEAGEYGNRALRLSSGYVIDTGLSGVALPFTIGVRWNSGTNWDAPSTRVAHFTQGTGLATIFGFQSGIGGIRVQNYDGAEDVSARQNLADNTWYTLFATAYADNTMSCDVNGTIESAACTWTAGPTRFTVGYADWGSSEHTDGAYEWWAWWAEALTIQARAELRRDPYQFLIPA